MAQNTVDLAGLFQSVTQALAENQQNLNQADEVNRNHGDNMVRTFETITGALQKKEGSSASTALAYAARQLSKNTASGSSQLYAQNLSQAAAQFKGKKVDSRGAMELLQTLIGGGQTSSAGQSGGADMLGALLGNGSAQGGANDLLGSLLGSLTGGEAAPAQSSAQGGDMGGMLGALLGAGGGSSASQQSGLDLQDLLSGAMAFMQAKQSGGDTLTALVQAFTAASGMGDSAHRQQSTQIVVNSFLQALSLGAKKINRS